jgi:hypothetical protein
MQSMHRAAHFLRCRVNDEVKVGDGGDVSMHEDGNAADHYVANMV